MTIDIGDKIDDLGQIFGTKLGWLYKGVERVFNHLRDIGVPVTLYEIGEAVGFTHYGKQRSRKNKISYNPYGTYKTRGYKRKMKFKPY